MCRWSLSRLWLDVRRIDEAQLASPQTPMEALRPYYDGLDIDLPRLPDGASEVPTQVTRIAFGSCLNPKRPAPILDAFAATRPDLVVMMGDNVYGDVRYGDATLPELRAAYAALAELDAFQAVNEAAPILAIWDDHDYGVNDGGGEFAMKEFAEAIFLEFWRTPEEDPRRARPGLYSSHMFGPSERSVHVIMLDTRFFRSPLTRGPDGFERDMDTVKTMLGEAQWAWLEETLQTPATLTVIVSSIQIIAEGHPYEKWINLPHERERLLNLIREHAAGDVVLASGDRHRAGLYSVDIGDERAIYELTSSSLNLPSSLDEEPGPNRLGDTYGDVNFGLLDIDWE